MNRPELRKQLLAVRSQMRAEELERVGLLIADKVLASAWYHEAHNIHCFFGVTAKGEIPTGRILSDVISKGKNLVMPKVADRQGRLTHIRVTDLARLQPGPWDIPEPEDGDEADVQEIQLILVPGLAADRNGNRVGYGKGYYDRFLATARNSLKVMLVSDRFVLDHIPAEDHDIPVDLLVTEKEIIACEPGV